MNYLTRFSTYLRDIFFSRYYFLLILVFLSVSYFSFGSSRNLPYKIESDGKYYYQFLVSGFFDGDFDFTNNYQAMRYEWMGTEIDHYLERDKLDPITGRPINVFTVGPAILWSPFFSVTFVNANLLNLLGVQVDTNPWGKYFQYSVMYSAVVYTTAALYLLYSLLEEHFSLKASRLAIWLLLVSTNLYYYTVFEASMSHVYDLFTYVVYLYLFVKGVSRPQTLTYS